MTGPIDRSDGGRPISRQCTGHITSGPEAGRRCRRSANHGTTVCGSHGASAPQVRDAAARRLAEAEAVAVYEKFSPNGASPVDVFAALEALVARVTSFADFAAARIETLTAEHWAAFSPRTAAEVDMFRQACRDACQLLTATARLGLDERLLAQRKADMYEEVSLHAAATVHGVIERSLAAMDLSEEQWRIAREEFPRQLRALAAGDGTE